MPPAGDVAHGANVPSMGGLHDLCAPALFHGVPRGRGGVGEMVSRTLYNSYKGLKCGSGTKNAAHYPCADILLLYNRLDIYCDNR